MVVYNIGIQPVENFSILFMMNWISFWLLITNQMVLCSQQVVVIALSESMMNKQERLELS